MINTKQNEIIAQKNSVRFFFLYNCKIIVFLMVIFWYDFSSDMYCKLLKAPSTTTQHAATPKQRYTRLVYKSRLLHVRIAINDNKCDAINLHDTWIIRNKSLKNRILSFTERLDIVSEKGILLPSFQGTIILCKDRF